MPNYNLEGIGFINDSVGWIGGDDLQPTFKTTNGGLTWGVDTGFGVLTPPYHDYANGFMPGFSMNRFRRFGDTLMYATGKTVYKLNTKEGATHTQPGTAINTGGAMANYPNPFKFRTTISYSLPEAVTNATLEVYSFTGALIFSSNLGKLAQGKHDYPFAEFLLPGMYQYTLRTEKFNITNKMIVLR